MSDQFAVIAAHRMEFPINLMCRVLVMSRASHDAAAGRAPLPRDTADAVLVATLAATFTTCRRRYDVPRAPPALRAAGYRALRLRRNAVATDSDHVLPLAKDGGPVRWRPSEHGQGQRHYGHSDG